MKICFDARMIRHSGIGTYIRGILKHLTGQDRFDFTLFGDTEKIAEYPAKKILAPFPIYSLKEQVFFPALLRKEGYDVFHVPHYNAPLGCKGPLVATVHDLIHLKFPPSRLAYFYARAMLEAVCRKAARVITDSQNTLNDLVELIGTPREKIRVIHPAAGEEFAPGPSDKPPPKEAGEGPYLLYIGNVRPAKNIRTLVEAFLSAKSRIADLRLVLAGKDTMPDYTRQFEGRSDLRFLGEIPHSKLAALYRGAKAFVFPSLYEGFGLPPLEAMACGTPVIASNAASLPEVVGDAALLFDPRDPVQLAGLIESLWQNEQERRALSEKGLKRAGQFSWKRCADETAKVYEECLS